MKKHIIPCLGTAALKALRLAMIEKYYADLLRLEAHGSDFDVERRHQLNSMKSR